jgi:hypothetical protein
MECHQRLTHSTLIDPHTNRRLRPCLHRPQEYAEYVNLLGELKSFVTDTE